MTNSVTRLLRLVGLLVLCLAASSSLSAASGGGGGPQMDCSVGCAPGTKDCVGSCECDGALSCCISACSECCNIQ